MLPPKLHPLRRYHTIPPEKTPVLLRIPDPIARTRLRQFGPGVRQSRQRFQARVWLGTLAGGHVNLGLYETPGAALSIQKAVSLAVPDAAWTPLEIWRVAVALAATRTDAEESLILRELLPKWVHLGFGGKFTARVSTPDRIRLLGRYSDPVSAHRAALKMWEKIHGVKLRPPQWRQG